MHTACNMHRTCSIASNASISSKACNPGCLQHMSTMSYIALPSLDTYITLFCGDGTAGKSAVDKTLLHRCRCCWCYYAERLVCCRGTASV